MVGMVRAMKVAMAPTTKMAILMTHMISPSEAWQQIQSISLQLHTMKIFFDPRLQEMFCADLINLCLGGEGWV